MSARFAGVNTGTASRGSNSKAALDNFVLPGGAPEDDLAGLLEASDDGHDATLRLLDDDAALRGRMTQTLGTRA